MAEGTGEVGQQPKARDHRLKIGQGIVGMVANSNRYFLSSDVDKTPNFMRNPMLPDTNAELAVPLHKGERLLGVLDIQSRQLNRFSQEELTLI